MKVDAAARANNGVFDSSVSESTGNWLLDVDINSAVLDAPLVEL